MTIGEKFTTDHPAYQLYKEAVQMWNESKINGASADEVARLQVICEARHDAALGVLLASPAVELFDTSAFMSDIEGAHVKRV